MGVKLRMIKPTMIAGIPRAIRAALLKRLGFSSARQDTLAATAADATPAARSLEGKFVRANYSNRWGTRSYKTYVPVRGEGKPRPLVVMLHGCKQNPDDFAAGTRMNELADELGFVVAYPEQASAANVSRCWNWFQGADQKRDAGEPSLIAGITQEVIARCEVDPNRVYVAGLSAGGAMAAIMGRTYPDLYAAVGIHSGLPYAAARDVSSALAAMRGGARPAGMAAGERIGALPTIVFHGDADTTVHPSNGESAIAQATQDLALQKIQDGEESGRKYTLITQRDESGQPALEHWLVHGAGHAWSGGSASGSFADPRGPDASRAMLRFFFSVLRGNGALHQDHVERRRRKA
jgi:poly(hydroxyalkanoate) depolymerase family esterase